MLMGTFLAGFLCVVWVFGADHWKQADPQDPRKMLAQEVAAALRAPTGALGVAKRAGAESGERFFESGRRSHTPRGWAGEAAELNCKPKR
jgi:hypothetical protein